MIKAGISDQCVLARARLIDAMTGATEFLNSGQHGPRSGMEADTVPDAAEGQAQLAELETAALGVALTLGLPDPRTSSQLVREIFTQVHLDDGAAVSLALSRLSEQGIGDGQDYLSRVVNGFLGNALWDWNATHRQEQPSDQAPTSDAVSEDPDDEEFITWADVAVVPLPDQAPSWRLLADGSNWLSIRTNPVRGFRISIATSDRWCIEERHFVAPEDDDSWGEVNSIDRLGGIVCFVDKVEPEGQWVVSPPALLIERIYSEEDNLIGLRTLCDLSLEPRKIDDVPFPLDVELLKSTSNVVGGMLRRTLLNLWSLDVLCPRCGDLGDGQVNLGEGVLEGRYRCPTCRNQWPEQVPSGVMGDEGRHDWLGWWVAPIRETLAPLVQEGWVPDPFTLNWDWDSGATLTTTYRRGNDVIELTAFPEEMMMTLLGPVELGPEGQEMAMNDGPRVTCIVLEELLLA
jgi:hypothetical protein